MGKEQSRRVNTRAEEAAVNAPLRVSFEEEEQ
jgi:hypothetical protein